MKLKSNFILLSFIALLLPISVNAAKTVKIKLTGTVYENVQMTVGQTGRTEIISQLPYILEIPKDQMPITLKFQSDNYIYYNIDVPKKPFDTTGHVYLVKINETAMSLQRSNSPQASPVLHEATPSVVSGIDVTHGVNAAPVTGQKSPDAYALIITNENYDMAVKVDNATNDGLAFKEYCLKTLGIPGENVRHFTNLSFGKMRKAINDMTEIISLSNGSASLYVYYAGHGIPDNKTKNAFLMPVDADGTDTDICISLSDFYRKLNESNAQKCVVFLDACFSGAQRGGDMIVAARGVRIKPSEDSPKGKTIVFSATSGDEAAFSYKEEQHGLFTFYLLKKLQETKGKCKLGELYEYLSQNVGMKSRLLNNAPQTPTVAVADGMADNWKSLSLIK